MTVFRPREIKKLFDLCDDAHLESKQNAVFDYQEGDILDVVSGPFAGYKCEVVSFKRDKILDKLDMLWRTAPAEFTKEQSLQELNHDFKKDPNDKATKSMRVTSTPMRHTLRQLDKEHDGKIVDWHCADKVLDSSVIPTHLAPQCKVYDGWCYWRRISFSEKL